MFRVACLENMQRRNKSWYLSVKETEKYPSVFRVCSVVGSWPQAVELAAAYLSGSLVLAFAFLALHILAAIQPLSHNIRLLKLTFHVMASWCGCVTKLASTEMKQAGTKCSACSLLLSFRPTATTLNQFVSIPNEQHWCWDLNSINKWMSKQTSTSPTLL